MTAPKRKHVPRITQLDSASLDKEINSVLKLEVEEILRSTAPYALTRYEPEIDALLSLLVWKLSVYDKGATFGQSLLDLKYYNSSIRKRILLAALVIGVKYVISRTRTVAKVLIDESNFHAVEQVFRTADTLLRIANLANRVIFLTEGQYPGLAERVLRMPPTPASEQHNRNVGYSYMTRELLWHSLIELLLFVLPLINYRAWYARVRSLFQTKSELRELDTPELTLMSTCAVCNEKPILPQHIGCSHVFCAYCVKVTTDYRDIANIPSSNQ
ncbi:Hypothetical predicted protein [Cloeon dipterum]|uniref:RING-type E3 ubiquitin transferase (cysteine targeting) n=1 Tax=Cloeon dipterum TaxID=197152 RepID=A0A8S1C354_9INSE|nr:Hypothetical predicted protein [Cloeon dipterum]